jgi:hypothetical protein
LEFPDHNTAFCEFFLQQFVHNIELFAM